MATDAVWVDVLPSMEKFGPAVAKGSVTASGTAGLASGRAFGLAMIAGVAAVAGGAVLAGKALYDLGSTFDDMTDTIRVGTGATGAALDGLVASAKNVSTKVPADFDQISVALADINTRTGMTGPALEKFTSQVLEAGRLTGEAIDVNKVTASFSVFGIEGEAASVAMDTLYRVSQDTGVGMNELAANVQKAGPAIQELGFDFDQTAALVGGLDKAGLDASRMTAGLARSLVELAKDGEEPAEAFERITGEIQTMADTGDISGATELSAKLFGTKNAPAFMKAIQDGTLNMEDLTAAALGSGDTIMQASADTADFAEHWKVFSNQMRVLVEPVASRVFAIISDGMKWFNEVGVPYITDFVSRLQDDLLPTLRTMGEWIVKNKDWLTAVGVAVGTVVAAIGLYKGAMMAWQAVTKAAAAVQAAFNLALSANPIGIVVLAVAALAAGLVYFFTKTETGQKAWKAFTDFLGKSWDWIKTKFSQIFPPVRDAFVAIWGGIRDFGIAVWDGMKAAAQVAFNLLRDYVINPVKAVKSFWDTTWAAIKDFGATTWNWIKTTAEAVFNAMKMALEAIMNAFKASFERVWGLIKGVGQAAWNWIRDTATAVFEALKTALDSVMNRFKTSYSNIWEGIKSVGRVAWDWIKNTATAAFEGLKSAADAVMNRFKTSYGNIWGGIKSAGQTAWNWIKTTAEGVFDTMKTNVENTFSKLKSGLDRIWGGIKSVFAKPINVVIGFINTGVLGAYNTVADFLKLKKLGTIGKIPGYLRGGWTGPGARNDLAGAVHADEFVVNKPSRRKFEDQFPGYLDYINLTGSLPGYSKGGRVHPTGGGKGGIGTSYPGHTGRDFGRAYGSGYGAPVRAAGAGVITRTAKLATSYGWHIRQRLDEGLNAVYAHLSAIGVSAGQRVAAGQTIGRVGNTGNSKGAHLHFGINESDSATVAFLRGAAVGKGSGGGGIVDKIVEVSKEAAAALKAGFDSVKGWFDNIWGKTTGAFSSFKDALVGDNIVTRMTSALAGKLKDEVGGWLKDKLGVGYATGTASARPGWAWTGERGPELVRFRGGEQVLNAGQSRSAMVGGTVQQNIHLSVPKDAFTDVSTFLRFVDELEMHAHTSGGVAA